MPFRFVDSSENIPSAPQEKRKFRFVQEEVPKESLGSNIGRQVARGGARALETALGAPRAFGEFLEGIVPEKGIKKLAGAVGLKEPVEKGLEFSKRFAPYKLFPESSQIRENVTKRLFGKSLEPKNEWEQKADELVSDFAALALPFPGGKIRLLKPALLSLGANAASEGVGRLGGTKKEQEYAKIGTILAGSLIHPKSADKLRNELYSKAREARPSDAKVSSAKLEASAAHLENELLKGDPSAGSKKKSLELINKIRSKIKGNEIDIEELEEFKRNINEARSGLYEEFKTDKLGRKSAKRNLDSVSKLIDRSLNEYGKINPEWEAFYHPANEVHGAIAQSKRVRNWMFRNSKVIGFPTLAAELGLYHAAGLPGALGGAAVGAAGFGSAELMARIMKSPTLRKHYTNLVGNALKEDAVAVRENLAALDRELRKESNQKHQ